MKTKFLLLGVIVIVGAALAARVKTAALSVSGEEPRRLKIVTTIFPVYDMAKAIGGSGAEVSMLLPPGVEAHSFEPRPGDILKINEGGLFIYTSKAMEPWAEDIGKSAANKELLVVEAGQGAKSETGPGQGGSRAGNPDPHVWLDFDNARIMAANIGKAMEAKDPANKARYQKAAEAYKGELSKLDSEYRAALSACKSKEIVYAGHYAFGYLAARYGLKYTAAQGLSPDAEPSAKDLAGLVDQIRDDHVGFIFYEELTSPKIAETLKRETGAKMLLLSAAHNLPKDQFERGVSFFDIMRVNLSVLKEGLECR